MILLAFSWNNRKGDRRSRKRQEPTGGKPDAQAYARCSMLAALAAGLAQGAAAQAPYPNRTITVIVPFAAGGPTDVVARLIGEHMSRTLGQQLVVENVGGAGGSTGMTRAAQAAPDGYTIAVGNMGTQSAAPALYPNLKYDPANELRANRHRQFHAAGDRGQEGHGRRRPQGLHRLPPGQPAEAQLRPRRRRLDLARVGHSLQRQVRPQAGARRLSRHRSRPQRPGRRPDRLHGRPVAQRHPADQGRDHQGLCHRRAGAARKPAGRADHQGAGRRLYLQRLERHGRAQGHAEGDRRQARRTR